LIPKARNMNFPPRLWKSIVSKAIDPVSEYKIIVPESKRIPDRTWTIRYRSPVEFDCGARLTQIRKLEAIAIISQKMKRVRRSPAKVAPTAAPAYKRAEIFWIGSRTWIAKRVAIIAAM
jgi:hypothetical protein